MWLLGLRMGLGVCFFVLGIIGILIPVMPQVIFFVLAALMFFPRHRRLNVFLDKREAKMPRAVSWLRRIGIGSPDEPCSTATIQSSPRASCNPSPAYEPDITDQKRYPD
jgi:uncharacterized membrane protein YbaN (DUF454 family)